MKIKNKEPLSLTLSKVYLIGAIIFYWIIILNSENINWAYSLGMTAKYILFIAYAYGKMQWKILTLGLIFISIIAPFMNMSNWFYLVDIAFLSLFGWYILKYR